MRLLSRLLVIIAISLVATAQMAVPAQADEEPYITLSPSRGTPETEITVRGYYFTPYEWVDIYYYLDTTERIYLDEVQATSAAISFTAYFTIPERCKGSYNVLAAGDKGNFAYAAFTVKPGLTVSPEEGLVSTNVTVAGKGFAKNEADIELYFSDELIEEDITADANGSWNMSFQIPSSSKGSHEIDARGDDSSFTEVEDAIFELTPGISIDKSSGMVGDNLTVTGNGFVADERDITIFFDGEAVVTEIRADERGYWERNFNASEMTTGTYSITAEGEWTKQRDIDALSFEIKAGILLSPDQGHVGMNLTVTGLGFAANKNVVIKYDASQKATASTNANGSFSGVSFSVPESIHGAHQVTAEDAAENEATAIFTMESEPPDTPELISPPDGGRGGFVGKVTPTFIWEEVEDPSGVYYSLQIAISDNVTDTGEFADPIVSVAGLVGTNYTLEKTEALSYGTYYWIVQAVDRAENAGNWTAVYSFRAGLLPLGAFIAIIVAIVVLIGAAVYFFIIRRKTYY
jgi:hypothetical protein